MGKLHDILDKIHSDFLVAYSTYKNGKNKKTRNDAEREVDSSIRLADMHIKNNWEVYELYTGGPEVSDYGRAVIYEEFCRPHYFGGDLNKLLNMIREKIKTFED